MATATASPSTESSVNDVLVEDVGPARKRLTITIPARVIDEKLEESMSTLATQTVLPGFRKGKVPKSLISKRFGGDVRNETKNQLIASAYAAAIEQNQIKPVGEPEPSEGMADLKVEDGKPLKFAVEVEVAPQFELPAFDGIEVKKPMLQISQEHIDGELDRHRLHLGTATEVKEDFKPGDRLVGYATCTKADETEPFFRQDNVLVVVPDPKEDGGKGQVLGLMIDDLASLLKGASVGQTLTIKTTGPENHEREDIRGVSLTMTYEIRLAERIDPAPIEKVVEHYGLPGADILLEQMKLALEQRRDAEQSAAMREQAVEKLAEMVDFELPEKLSAQQANRQLERLRMELLYRGVTPEDAEEQLADVRGESDAAAKTRLKMFFLLFKLAEHFNVEVSDQEVNGRIAAIAAQRGVRPERLRTELAQAGRMGEVASQIRDQKAADKLVAVCKQTEVSADEWNRLVREKQAKVEVERTKKVASRPKKAPAKKAAADEEDDAPARAAKPAAKKKTTKKKSS